MIPATVTPALLDKAQRRLTKARTRLLIDPQSRFVFWATCALHLRFVPTSMAGQGGMIGTDGRNLYYDPIWIAEGPWTDAELMGVVAHEVSHCVKGDNWRRGAREPRRWNLAADARINPELLRAGLSLPSNGDPSLTALLQNPANYGRSAEEIYASLPPSPNGGGGEDDSAGAKGAGDPMAGDVRQPSADGDGTDSGDGTEGAAAGKPLSAADIAVLERKWTVIARKAAQIAQAQGTLPGTYAELLEPVKPALDPYALLRHFVTMCRRDDYSWGRVNRRSLYRNICLPALWSTGVGELVIAVDTSGSMSSATLSRCLGFLNSVLVDVRPELTHFIELDTRVAHSSAFSAGEMLPETVPVHGRGGTCMAPLWQWIADENIQPVCAIVLSDMCMGRDDFGEPQHFPVLWVSTTKGAVAPFGETVEMLDAA